MTTCCPIRTRACRRGSALGLALVAVLVVGVRQLAAVSVSPVALYIDARTRTGTLTLFNNGTRPEEIEIAFAFGYPRSDSLGVVATALLDRAPDGEPSALGWLRAFPRRLVLAPGQRQVVRIMVQAPAGLPEGEYWGRVLIKSRGGHPPIEQSQGSVNVQLDIETVMAIALSYRQGHVQTGVEVVGADAVRRGDTAVATLDLRRTGNAAFVGRFRVEAVDASGKVVGKAEDYVAVYHDLRRRVPVVLPAGMATRPLQMRVTLDTQRDDLPPDGPLPVAEVRRTFPLR